eukprot:12730769-Alexandrium_andersonii.AAC.1
MVRSSQAGCLQFFVSAGPFVRRGGPPGQAWGPEPSGASGPSQHPAAIDGVFRAATPASLLLLSLSSPPSSPSLLSSGSAMGPITPYYTRCVGPLSAGAGGLQ